MRFVENYDYDQNDYIEYYQDTDYYNYDEDDYIEYYQDTDYDDDNNFEDDYNFMFFAKKPAARGGEFGNAYYSIGNGSKPWTLVEKAGAQGATYSLEYSTGRPIDLVVMKGGSAGYRTKDGRVRSLPKTVVTYLRNRGIKGITGALSGNTDGMVAGTYDGPLTLTDGQTYPGFSYF